MRPEGFQPLEACQRGVASGNQLQGVGEVGARAAVVALPAGSELDAIDDTVGRPAEQQRQPVPLPLLEPGLHPQFRRQQFGQFNLKPGELAGVFRIEEDMGTAPLLIGRPDQLSSRHHLFEFGGSHAARSHGASQQQRDGQQQTDGPPPPLP